MLQFGKLPCAFVCGVAFLLLCGSSFLEVFTLRCAHTQALSSGRSAPDMALERQGFTALVHCTFSKAGSLRVITTRPERHLQDCSVQCSTKKLSHPRSQLPADTCPRCHPDQSVQNTIILPPDLLLLLLLPSGSSHFPPDFSTCPGSPSSPPSAATAPGPPILYRNPNASLVPASSLALLRVRSLTLQRPPNCVPATPPFARPSPCAHPGPFPHRGHFLTPCHSRLRSDPSSPCTAFSGTGSHGQPRAGGDSLTLFFFFLSRFI